MYLLKSLNISFWARHSYRLDGGEILGHEGVNGSACGAIEIRESIGGDALYILVISSSPRESYCLTAVHHLCNHRSLRLLLLSSTTLTWQTQISRIASSSRFIRLAPDLMELTRPNLNLEKERNFALESRVSIWFRLQQQVLILPVCYLLDEPPLTMGGHTLLFTCKSSRASSVQSEALGRRNGEWSSSDFLFPLHLLYHENELMYRCSDISLKV
jgi:hypothetical protein